MSAALTTYFAGEKSAGMMLAAIGIVVLAGAALLFPARYELRAFAITLAVWGVIELTIGVGLWLKTDAQVAELVAKLAQDPTAFYAAERPRMAGVQRNFVIIEIAEIVLIVGCAALALALKGRPIVSGIALGVLINAAMLLAFDIVAERRGAIYHAALAVES
jgi:hypothetical protein